MIPKIVVYPMEDLSISLDTVDRVYSNRLHITASIAIFIFYTCLSKLSRNFHRSLILFYLYESNNLKRVLFEIDVNRRLEYFSIGEYYF
jgi:hypothetical protein